MQKSENHRWKICNRWSCRRGNNFQDKHLVQILKQRLIQKVCQIPETEIRKFMIIFFIIIDTSCQFWLIFINLITFFISFHHGERTTIEFLDYWSLAYAFIVRAGCAKNFEVGEIWLMWKLPRVSWYKLLQAVFSARWRIPHVSVKVWSIESPLQRIFGHIRYQHIRPQLEMS